MNGLAFSVCTMCLRMASTSYSASPLTDWNCSMKVVRAAFINGMATVVSPTEFGSVISHRGNSDSRSAKT